MSRCARDALWESTRGAAALSRGGPPVELKRTRVVLDGLWRGQDEAKA